MMSGKTISRASQMECEYFVWKSRNQFPSYVPVAGELAYVLHSNQVKTCKHCTQKIHIGKSCSAVRKETSRIAGENSTLAEIVGNTQTNEGESLIDLMDATVGDSDGESIDSEESAIE